MKGKEEGGSQEMQEGKKEGEGESWGTNTKTIEMEEK